MICRTCAKFGSQVQFQDGSIAKEAWNGPEMHLCDFSAQSLYTRAKLEFNLGPIIGGFSAIFRSPLAPKRPSDCMHELVKVKTFLPYSDGFFFIEDNFITAGMSYHMHTVGFGVLTKGDFFLSVLACLWLVRKQVLYRS